MSDSSKKMASSIKRENNLDVDEDTAYVELRYIAGALFDPEQAATMEVTAEENCNINELMLQDKDCMMSGKCTEVNCLFCPSAPPKLQRIETPESAYEHTIPSNNKLSDSEINISDSEESEEDNRYKRNSSVIVRKHSYSNYCESTFDSEGSEDIEVVGSPISKRVKPWPVATSSVPCTISTNPDPSLSPFTTSSDPWPLSSLGFLSEDLSSTFWQEVTNNNAHSSEQVITRPEPCPEIPGPKQVRNGTDKGTVEECSIRIRPSNLKPEDPKDVLRKLMERQRYHSLLGDYERLKQQLPRLAHVSNATKLNILQEATKVCLKFQKKEAEYERQRKINIGLNKYLRHLKKEMTSKESKK